MASLGIKRVVLSWKVMLDQVVKSRQKNGYILY